MHRTWKTSVVSLIVVLATVTLPAPTHALRKISPNAVPAGAIKLGNGYSQTWTKKMAGLGTVSCWSVKGRRVPGEQIGYTNKAADKWIAIYFLPYAQRSKNATAAARKATGAKKKALLAEAKTFAAKEATYAPLCKRYDTPVFNTSGASAIGLLTNKVARTSASSMVDRVRVFSAYEVWGSNLVTVDATGTVADALTTGTLDIGAVFSAPSGKVYLQLRTPQFLSEDGLILTMRTGKGCVIAEVVVSAGTLTCVDDTLSQAFDFRGVGRAMLGSQFVQFDDAGGVYYTGYARADGAAMPTFVLRRSVGTVHTDLINEQITLADFMVLGDGSILVSGLSSATSARWTRRISPTGSLSGLLSKMCSFRRFPDGTVFAYCDSAWYRYDAATQTMVDGGLTGVTAASILGALSNGSVVSRNGSVFSLVHPAQSTIATSQVTTVQTARVTNDMILVSGLKNGKNVTTVINALTGVETVLLSAASDEFEIYHFGDIATSTSTVIVDGLRFSDNKYFTGRLNVATGAFSVSLTGLGKFADFQVIQ